MDGDALRAHRVCQRFGDVGILRAQEAFATDDDVGRRAQRLQHARDFAGDVAAADDDGALWLVLQREEVVRGFAARCAFDVCGDSGLAAGGDDDVFAAVKGVADAHGVGALKAGETTDEGDAAFVEIGFVDAV